MARVLRHVLEPRPAGPSAGDIARGRAGERSSRVAAVRDRIRRAPEIGPLIAVSAFLNLWALGRNDWANVYYSAAVRSMASSWHDFLYASLDRAGVMTVDKPPLSLWVQSLSVRLFGFHPLAILVPQALMGVATVLLVYDLVRRRFGRLGGFISGLALATTPIAVAMSRDNNPDALLTLCCVAAVWFAVRGFEDGRTRWLVLSGVAVGLGFETKMLVALVVVPAIALAWLWIAPAGRGRLAAIRQLLGGGVAMLVVGGAWPLLVALTPTADRPFVSGTADNSILSLIFGYNGFGRVGGQVGGPPSGFGGAGAVFGGATGPFRLINAALGGQDGWLLGFAVAGASVIVVASRLRRRDPRTAWLICVGGAFILTAALFSFAHGIFHPYYVVLLAPFTAALVGAGVATLVEGRRAARVAAPAALALGVACELVVRSDYVDQLDWMPIVLPLVCGLAAVAVFVFANRRVRAVALAIGVGALIAAPAVWAVDTLGYRTVSTFPAGGPQTVIDSGGGPGAFGFGPRGLRGGVRIRFYLPGGVPPSPFGGGSNGASPPSFGGRRGFSHVGLGPPQSFGGGNGFPGGGFAGGVSVFPNTGNSSDTLPSDERYVRAHGGGAIAVASQSFAALAILANDADVAGIGGFGGVESDPSVAWLAKEVADGNIRWLDTSSLTDSSPGRPGASAVVDAAIRACTPVTAASSNLYDCAGRASAILATTR
ncbi:MAG TPA: glycosyltransferase family 39 protein [Solirubrobacteraceae bacterium]|nr:glycosyltransferase family 39 protein [Solirubrobacteraceae bacterium]